MGTRNMEHHRDVGGWMDANTRYDGGEESGKGRRVGKKKKRAQIVDQTPVSDLIHCRGGRAAGGQISRWTSTEFHW